MGEEGKTGRHKFLKKLCKSEEIDNFSLDFDFFTLCLALVISERAICGIGNIRVSFVCVFPIFSNVVKIS